MKKTTGKIAVMGASFALFLCGAGALQLERGTARTVILAVVRGFADDCRGADLPADEK